MVENKKGLPIAAIDLMIINIIRAAVKLGDQVRLNFLLDRIIGRVKERVEISGSLHTSMVDTLDKYRNKDNLNTIEVEK